MMSYYRKTIRFFLVVVVGALWTSSNGILLQGDDVKESSSETPKDTNTSEVPQTSLSEDALKSAIGRLAFENKDKWAQEICDTLLLENQALKDISPEKILLHWSELAGWEAVGQEVPPAAVNTKESSSETPGDHNASEGIFDCGNGQDDDLVSESTGIPPIAAVTKALPSGRIWGVKGEDNESVMTGDTGRQMQDFLKFDEDDFGYQGDSIFAAIDAMDMVAVQRILDKPSTNVNEVDENKQTALHLASEQGLDEVVQKLLTRADVDVNKKKPKSEREMIDAETGQRRTTDSSSATVLATEQNHLTVVQLLSEHQQIHIEDVNYSFYLACVLSHVEIVNHLIGHAGIDVNYDPGDGNFPLFAACQAGNLEAAQKLLEHPLINVNKTTDQGATPLHSVAQRDSHVEVAKKLLEHPKIDVNKTMPHFLATPLHYACFFGSAEIVKVLLEHPAIKVNACDNNGSTPFTVAAELGHIEIVKLFLENPDNDFDKYGERAIEKASEKDHTEIVELLRNHTSKK